MTRTDRFASLADFRAEKQRLAALRERHKDQLMGQLAALKRGSVRSNLVKNTVTGMIGNSMPGKLIGALIGKGGLGSGFGMALGVGKGSLLKRLGMFAVGMAAPKLIQRIESISLEDIGHELKVSWERWKEHQEQRKMNKEEH